MEPKTVVELQLRHTDTRIDLLSNNNLLSVLFEFCIWQLVLVAILGLCTGSHWVARSMRPDSWESRCVFPCAVPTIWSRTSNMQVVYRLNLFLSRLPLRPLALASPQFYVASRVCNRLSQMVVLFGCPSFWQFFLSQNLILHKFSHVH